MKAIRDCAASISPSGLLRSHWPSSFEQIISTYSLQWIGMIFDHYQYNNLPERWGDLLPTARGIMQWFINRTRRDGLLGHIAEAAFIDWAFPAGCPPQAVDGGSVVLTALVAETMTMLATLEEAGGYAELAPRWRQQAEVWREAVVESFDAERQLFPDTVSKHQTERSFSLHAQVQAVLAGCSHPGTAAELLQRASNAPDVRQPNTLYYRSHLAAAWRVAGRPDAVVDMFAVWFDLLELGMTTWPENDRPQSRSDCHAWGCMPEIELIHSVFGLTPLAPGWQRIRCQPHWSALLPQASCHIRLPSGTCSLTIDQKLIDGVDHIHWQLETPVACEWISGEELAPGIHQGSKFFEVLIV